MERLCPLSQNDIDRLSSFLGLDPSPLLAAAEEICSGKSPSRTPGFLLPKLRSELKKLIGYEELTDCFISAMAVLRRISSGEFVWKVFCKSDQEVCKRPRSDYNVAFRELRGHFEVLWSWNQERGGYSISDSVRMLLLYELFLHNPERLKAFHAGAACTYKESIERRAEYKSPDFEMPLIEYVFHAGSAVKISYRLFPLQTVTDDKRGNVERDMKDKVFELKKQNNLMEFLKNKSQANILADRCIQRLRLDREVLMVTGTSEPEDICNLLTNCQEDR